MEEQRTKAEVPETFLIRHKAGEKTYYVFCTTVFSLNFDSLKPEHSRQIDELFSKDASTVALDQATIEQLPVWLNRASVMLQSSQNVGPPPHHIAEVVARDTPQVTVRDVGAPGSPPE
jgi:hypothetical protein